MLFCNHAVRCSVPETARSPLKLLVLQRAIRSANTSDTFRRVYNFNPKTGSGFIIDI